jgi:hypothetical protein
VHPYGTTTPDTTTYVVDQAMLVLTSIKERIVGEDKGDDIPETYRNEIPDFREV